jgi:flavin reductase (DIM6/NTAB) family NADH-FMN oxidoreductase RutF
VFVKFSKPATFDPAAMTLNDRAVRAGGTGAPIFADAIAWLDCAVRASHDVGTHTLFIGEVVDAAINADEGRAAAMSDTRMKYGGVKRH